MRHTYFLLLAVAGLNLMAQGVQDWPKTVVEISNFEQTSKVADVRAYMEALGKVAPDIKAYRPPTAPETTETGKPILAWRIPATGPNPLKVYVNANIHAGEVEGKEAIQLVARGILQGRYPDIRKNIELVFCPAYNADGTDALNPANRTHQPNPKSGVGPRENIFGLDLNRDMMKAVAANTRWMLAMYRDFDPDCTIDLHSTNGSRHGFYLTYAPGHATGGDLTLAAFNRQMLTEIRESLLAKGLPTYDYGNFRTNSERQVTSWETDSLGQNMVSNYALLENRLGILVETFVYRSYEDRVEDNIKFIFETLGWMASNKEEVQRQRSQAAERWAGTLAKGDVQIPLKAKMVQTETYTFDSFEFAMNEQGTPLRDNRGRYTGEKTFTKLTLPSFVTFEWTDYVTAPVGYLVDRAHAEKILPLLEAHGVMTLPGTQRPKNETLMYFHETVSERKISNGAYQGVFTLSLSGAWKPELPSRRAAYSWEQDDLDSAIYVPVNQPMGKMAFYLLDPRAPDGLVFWGYFNSSFIRGQGMWGEGPRCPILALGINAAGPASDANTTINLAIEE
ncbi:MAG: hypothetical protein FWG12_04015 [Holophagaceae bacterium]|nr:hypothetical protein [Holophagaceae bacterium]